jgi:type IV pilus assembly protein PilF
MRAWLAVLVLAVAGCVTESESVFTEEASPQAALQQRLTLARQYIGRGNYEDAKRNLSVAVGIDDGNAEVLRGLRPGLSEHGGVRARRGELPTRHRAGPRLLPGAEQLRAFLYSQGRYREAESQLSEVVKDTLYPARAQAFLNLGLCRLQLFDETGAEQAFMRTLAMQGDNSIALLEVAQLRLKAGDSRNASIYYGKYRDVVRQQSARGLWFGVRLARARGDRDAESSFALALRNLYPESVEYEAYLRSLDDQAAKQGR